MLEWREQLESMMTGYFERFEANENRFLDWAFAARHVMEFFYQGECGVCRTSPSFGVGGGVTEPPGGGGLHQGVASYGKAFDLDNEVLHCRRLPVCRDHGVLEEKAVKACRRRVYSKHWVVMESLSGDAWAWQGSVPGSVRE